MTIMLRNYAEETAIKANNGETALHFKDGDDSEDVEENCIDFSHPALSLSQSLQFQLLRPVVGKCDCQCGCFQLCFPYIGRVAANKLCLTVFKFWSGPCD